MGFLKRTRKNTFRDGQSTRDFSSFEHVTEDQLEEHLGVARYGNFTLTDAVRPSYDLQVIPEAGYRHDVFHDRETGIEIPVILAAASREHIFDLFLDLLDPLGEQVDAVLETSHDRDSGDHDDLYREHIDLPVLKSVLCDFEEMLLDDGCAGIAALNPQRPLEVQFDEHKLLVMYGSNVGEFEPILKSYGLRSSDEIRFITEAEHVHSSSEEYGHQFEQLRFRLGIDD
jgi:hypothetical protein